MSANTTQIQYRGLNFLLCQAPSDRSMPDFMKTMKEHNVTKIVRCCEQTYSDKPLKEAGVTVIDFDYPDGDVPPICLLDSLRSLLLPSSTSVSSEEAICIHCQSGLGRGPLLAALALVEKGMPAQGAIDLLRSKIRGCINSKQLSFINNYRPPRKKGASNSPTSPPTGYSPTSPAASPSSSLTTHESLKFSRSSLSQLSETNIPQPEL